jgi:hypothetical protein
VEEGQTGSGKEGKKGLREEEQTGLGEEGQWLLAEGAKAHGLKVQVEAMYLCLGEMEQWVEV